MQGIFLVVFDWSQCWFMPCQRPVWQTLLVQQSVASWNSKIPAGSWNTSKLNSGESTVSWKVCFCFSGQDETCEPVFQLSCWTVDVQEELLPFVYWKRCVCYFQLQSAFQGVGVKMFCMWVECSAKKKKNRFCRFPVLSQGQVIYGVTKVEIKSSKPLQESYLQLDLCHMIWSHALVGKRIFICSWVITAQQCKINFASDSCPAWTC